MIVKQSELPNNVPHVPEGYNILVNADNVIFAKAPEDKRKGNARVSEQRPMFALMQDDNENYAWVPEKDYNTRPVREFMIAQGLASEILFGIRMTNKAPKCSTIIRQEYGMKGTSLSLYMQFTTFRGLKKDSKIVEMALKEGVR